jgi:hypothetical protein
MNWEGKQRTGEDMNTAMVAFFEGILVENRIGTFKKIRGFLFRVEFLIRGDSFYCSYPLHNINYVVYLL